VRRIIISPIIIQNIPYPWNHIAVPEVINSAPIAAVIGQGLYSTK
jgi:hypothetical protein